MSVENTKYDELATHIYHLHRGDKRWPNWSNIKRTERDYWRALAQVATEQQLWPERRAKRLQRTNRTRQRH